MVYDGLISKDFCGIVSVLQDDKVDFEYVAGNADLANERPIDIETKFQTSTAGKIFIACAIMNLIEKNRLKLTTKIGDVVNLYLGKIDMSISVKELLTHTSGIPDYFYEAEMGNYDELFRNFPNYRVREPKDLLPMFINKPMKYQTYGQFIYTNAGYILLALAIESIMGMSFEQYLKKKVFDPCEMENTGFFEHDKLPPNCAVSYIYENETDTYRSNIYSSFIKGLGPTGPYSSVGDIHKFWSHFYAGDIIGEKYFRAMITPQVAEGYYGYGTWIRSGMPIIQGSEPGISFISQYNESLKRSTVIISNYAHDVWSILDNITEREEESFKK